MRIGKLILRMRLKQAALARRSLQHTFDNFVGGSVELAKAQQIPAQRDICFIVPLGGSAEKSAIENFIDQILVERFAVIVCLKADTTVNDEYGVLAYDRLHDIRNEVMSAFIGLQLGEAEGVIRYNGETLLDYDSAYLWYQFEFEYPARVMQRTITDASNPDSADYTDGGVEDNGWQDIDLEEVKQLKTLYTQYILTPDDRIPLAPGQGLPIPDGFPDVRLPNIAQWVDEDSVEESEG